MSDIDRWPLLDDEPDADFADAALREFAESYVDPEDRACRVCGCTEDNACVDGGLACSWVADDLCSFCEEGTLGRQSRAPLVELYTEGDLNAAIRDLRAGQ